MNESIPVPIWIIEALQSGEYSPVDVQVVLATIRLSNDTGAVTVDNLASDQILREAITSLTDQEVTDENIETALSNIESRGMLVIESISVDRRMVSFASAPSSLATENPSPEPPADSNNAWAYRLFEQHIGPLTPLVADQISHAVEIYPDDWIRDAVRDAVTYNRRSWRYIQRILANWSDQAGSEKSQESTGNETRRGRPEESIDTSRYRKGKHLERAKRVSM